MSETMYTRAEQERGKGDVMFVMSGFVIYIIS